MKKLILVLALLALICPFMGMKLYLTNTSSSGQTQSDPNASLGGYRSTTELSATSMKNLFDDVSVVEALLGDTEYRMIDVYNDGTGTAYGVQLYMQTATSSSSTELDFGYSSTNQPHADAWNGEALSNESTAPASPSMSFANYTKTSPLSLGTIPASQSKRVCVRRTVTAGAPWTAHDLGRFGVRWGGVAAPAGDTCGTDDCTFIWYAEHATDVTSGTPAGCSSGDTSPALTGATISSAQHHDGSNSLLVDHVSEYAAFDVADILSATAGTVEAWVRVSSWTNSVVIFKWNGTADGVVYLNVAGSSNTDIEFHFRYGYPYANLDLTTDGVNGVLDTWYRVVIKWTQSNVDPNIGIYVYNADGDLLDSETNNTNPNAWGTITGTAFTVGCAPYFAAETPAINIDGVKIWNAWKD